MLASDLSTKVLDKAREGVWPVERSADVPTRYLKASMQRGVRSEDGKMRAGDGLRSMVEFRRINLSREDEWSEGPFDLLFCRNVLIYFDGASKEAVIERLLRRLSPDGLLFLGHAESLNGWSDRVRKVGPNVYVRSGRRA